MATAHLDIPTWTGKALGAAAGLILAPASPGALVWWISAGVMLGHALDSVGTRMLARQAGPRTGAGEPDVASGASLRFTFAALGRIAATAGENGPEHRRYPERLMKRLGFSPERRREALVWFHAGRDAAFPFDSLAASCRHDFAAHPVLKNLAMQSMCGMAALADSPQATAELLDLGESVGWERGALAAQAVAMAALLPEQHGPVEQARATLGVREDDSADVIRLAYRRRVARWHPDRLPQDSSDRERAAAADQMWRLREALELLVAQRQR